MLRFQRPRRAKGFAKEVSPAVRATLVRSTLSLSYGDLGELAKRLAEVQTGA